MSAFACFAFFSYLALALVTGVDTQINRAHLVTPLEGIWTVVSAETQPNPGPVPDTVVIIKGHQVAVASDALAVPGEDLTGIQTTSFEIDEHKHTLDLLWQGRLLSIYRLRGNELTVCVSLSKERPKSFSPNNTQWVFKLKRQRLVPK